MNVQTPTPTDDLGAWINRQLQTDQAIITIPPGRFTLSTPIKPLGPSNRDQVIQGSGQRQTILEIRKDAHMIGIDLRKARQVTVRDVEVKEAKGSQKSLCIALGGTSCNVWNVWLGNAKYGIVGAMGAGISLRDIRVEAMKFEAFLFQSGFTDLKVGLDKTTNIRHVLGQSLFAYNCGTGVAIKKGLGNKTQKIQLGGVSVVECNTPIVNECAEHGCSVDGLVID